MATRSPAGAVAAGAMRSWSAVRWSAGARSSSVTVVPPTRHARARQVAAEQILDQFLRGRIGQGLAFVRPFLELDEAARFGARGIEPAELGELAHGALRVERPEGGLQHFHRKRAKLPRGGFGMAPHVRKRTARSLGIVREMPRARRSSRRARSRLRWRPRSPSCRRGNSRSARPARRSRATGGATAPRHARRPKGRDARRLCPSRAGARGGPCCAMAAVSETSPSRSRIRGGLMSEGTRIAGGPAPAMVAQASCRRCARSRASARDARGAAPVRRRARPASAARASSGSRSATSRTSSRNNGSGRGARCRARSCCGALCSGSRGMARVWE